MKIILSIINILFVFSLHVCQAQQGSLLFNSSRSYNFGYRFSNPQGSPEIAQNILSTLAQGNAKNINSAGYSVGMEQTLEIMLSNNYLQVGVRNSFIQPTGDVYFRNFYVGDVLIPTAINMLVNIIDNRNNLIQSIQIGNLTYSNNYSTLVNTNIYPLNDAKFNLQPVNIMLYYNEQTKINFDNRINTINQYYESNMILENAQGKLYAIAYVSPDNIDETLAILQQVENEVNNIESKNYNNLLNLTMQDPINLIQRIAAIRNILIQKRSNVNQTYAALDRYYYSKGLDALTQNNLLNASAFFNKSLSLNPQFAPSAYQLTKMKFDEGDVLNADLNLRNVWFNMTPDPNTSQNCFTLFKNIYIQYLNDASSFKEKAKYSDALKLYDRADKLCHEINGINCNSNLNANVLVCRQGVYENLLNEAILFAAKGNTNEAYEQYNEAIKFADSNNGNIENTAKENETIKAIKFNEYKSTAAAAKVSFEKADYNDALLKFEAAHDFETKYKFSPSIIPLDIEQKNAAKVILLKLDEVNTSLTKSTLEETKKLMAKVIEMQEFYKLNTDNEINNKLIPCKQKVIEQMCTDANKKYNENIINAKNSITENNFIIASDFYEKAILIVENNAECNLDLSLSKDEKGRILPAATYQKLINKILDMQLNGQYKQAIEKYKDAMAYYITFELDKFKLNKKDLLNFGKDNFKNGALDYLANYFREKSELDKSLELYKILIARNYPFRNIKIGLEDLGAVCALRDKASKIENPKIKVLEYVGNNGGLKSFKKAYLKIFETK